MIIVADSSCFVALIKIGHLDILPRLFGSVIIPTEVAAELTDPNSPREIREFTANLPAWLTIQRPSRVRLFAKLHQGECEAISLALELGADLLIIDDRHGHRAAVQCGLKTARTTTILLQAADQGLLDLKSAFDRLRQTDFRISQEVLEQLLEKHRSRGGT